MCCSRKRTSETIVIARLKGAGCVQGVGLGPHAQKNHKVYMKIWHPISGIQTRMQKAVLSLKRRRRRSRGVCWDLNEQRVRFDEIRCI